MAKILYWIVMQPDRTYKVEVTKHGIHQQSQGGFRNDVEAELWVDAQRAATGGMDEWERQSDFPSH